MSGWLSVILYFYFITQTQFILQSHRHQDHSKTETEDEKNTIYPHAGEIAKTKLILATGNNKKSTKQKQQTQAATEKQKSQ